MGADSAFGDHCHTALHPPPASRILGRSPETPAHGLGRPTSQGAEEPRRIPMHAAFCLRTSGSFYGGPGGDSFGGAGSLSPVGQPRFGPPPRLAAWWWVLKPHSRSQAMTGTSVGASALALTP